MTRIVKPELAQDLTDLFPVLEPKSLSPDDLSSTLQLTHDFLPGTHKLRLARNFSTTSPAAVSTTPFIFPNDFFFPGYGSSGSFPGEFVPDGFYVYVGGCNGNHNDTVNHNLGIFLQSLVGGVVVNGPYLAFAIGIGATAAVVVGRPFLIPPNFGLAVNAEAALGAGKTFTISVEIVPHRLLDPAPRF